MKPNYGHSSMAMSETPNSAKAEHILIAIPVLNEARHIETCIRSLMQGDARLPTIAIVVADGGSTDATRDIVAELKSEFSNLSLIDNPAKLQAAGINTVARQADSRVIRHLIRCDAHAIYPPGYVTAVADALVRTKTASLVVPMDAVGTSCFQKANAWVVDTVLGSGGSAHRGGTKSGYVDHGHHAGFDLGTFLKLDGYDEIFSHNEDAEYDQRVINSGGQIYLDATIRLKYMPRADVGSLARQYFNYGRGRARNILKHGAKPKLRQLVPVLNFLGLITAFIGAVWLPLLLAYPALYVSALILASLGISLKQRSLCGLLAGLASGIMHNAWAAGFLRQIVLRK